MKYRFPNPNNNEYINEYNSIIDKYENNSKSKDLSFHHILPRFKYPEYKNDEDNHLYLPVMEHIHMHYLLWKYDSEYCAAYWFCYTYFHKNYNYNILNEEVEQLKADMKKYRKKRK